MSGTASLEDILLTFQKGSIDDRTSFIKSCPESPLRDGALSMAAQSSNPTMTIMVLDVLCSAYSFGRKAELGAKFARVGHQLAKEAYENKIDNGAILLSTVSRFASNLINALNSLGRYDEAIDFANEVVPFYMAEGDTANLSYIGASRIDALLELNRIDEAKNLLEEEKRRGNDAPDLPRLEREIKRITGAVTDVPNDQGKGQTHQSNGPDLTDKPTHDLFRGQVDIGTARIGAGEEMNAWVAKKQVHGATSIFLGQPGPDEIKQSLKVLLELREWTKDNGTRTDDNDTLWGLYLCYNHLGQLSQAADVLKLLRENIEELRAEITNPLDRGGVSSNYPYLFPALCQKLEQTDRAAELLNAMEGAKGRAVADILTKRSGEVVDERELSAPAKAIPALMQTHAAHYVSYFIDDEETYAVLVAKDGSIHNAGSIPLGKKQVRTAAQHVDPRKWGKKELFDPFGQAVEDLTGTLAPLVSWLEVYFDQGLIEVGDHLCYSPDEHLHHIPLHYLLLGGKPLVNAVSVSRIHGAHNLRQILSHESQRPGSYTAIEVATRQNKKKDQKGFLKSLHQVPAWLADHLSGEDMVGETATVAAMAKLPLTKQIVHFATHGIFPADGTTIRNPNPFYSSGLVLAGDRGLPDEVQVAQGKDMACVLTPERLLDLGIDLTGSHVTMQACVSGLSKEGIGGDAMGLDWALSQAGASSILVSHWYISAKLSATFIEQFYQRWLIDGTSRAEAWRQTVLSIQGSNGKGAGPYAWAAFSLSGDWR